MLVGFCLHYYRLTTAICAVIEIGRGEFPAKLSLMAFTVMMNMQSTSTVSLSGQPTFTSHVSIQSYRMCLDGRQLDHQVTRCSQTLCRISEVHTILIVVVELLIYWSRSALAE